MAKTCLRVHGETGSVCIRQELFTDELAREYADKHRYPDVLFVSDIRTANHIAMPPGEAGARLDWDNKAQMRWHDIIRPRKSMLKFRLQYTPGKTEYLDGTVYLPVWGPQSTTETRLVPHGHGRRVWNNTKYEEQMFYFNTRTRVQTYKHDVEATGIDHCFDCASEVCILRRYLAKYGHNTDVTSPRDSIHRDLKAPNKPRVCKHKPGQTVRTLELAKPCARKRMTNHSRSTSELATSPSCKSENESLTRDAHMRMDVATGHLSETISREISQNRTLEHTIMDKRHGTGGWGFHGQQIQKLIDRGYQPVAHSGPRTRIRR